MDEVSWDEQCARDQAWDKASEYYIENGAHEFPSAPRTERCVASGRYNKMTPHCWGILKAQYPLGG